MKRVVVVSLAALVGVTAAGAGGERVTIRTRFLPDRANKVYTGETPRKQVILTGTIASQAARESVIVFVRECGTAYPSYRRLGAVATTAGGAWEFGPVGWGTSYSREGRSKGSYYNGFAYGGVGPSAYFRARWNDTFSEAILVRGPLVPEEWELHRTRHGSVFSVSVSTRDTGQKLARRPVELQRRTSGPTGTRWVRVRRAALRRVSHHFEARFRVRTRGLTLRVYVSDATAAPCYTAGWTLPVHS